MKGIEALILGIIQGLTEFLPVSSSGHLEIGKAIFGIHSEQSLTFTIIVHGATVMSIIVVFWKDIMNLIKGLFTPSCNDEKNYIAKLLVSAIPVAIIGLFFKDEVESLFTGNLLWVGLALMVTTALLTITYFAKDKGKNISLKDSFIIGIAQAVAVIPGISRSGATIATGLMLGNDKKETAKFSFLMSLIPIVGANLVDIMQTDWSATSGDISASSLIIGFIAAFLTGLFAVKFMLKIVEKSKLYYFAIYTFIVGTIAIIYALTH